MIKTALLTEPQSGDKQDFVVKMNKFFEAHNLSKDDIVHISMVARKEYLTEFYIIYDDGQ